MRVYKEFEQNSLKKNYFNDTFKFVVSRGSPSFGKVLNNSFLLDFSIVDRIDKFYFEHNLLLSN